VLGAEVAKELKAPLGLVLVRKIGHPGYAEYAIGALAEGEKPVYNEDEVASIDDHWLKQAETTARELIEHRRDLYYGEDFEPPVVTDKTVILVDDGVATGLTMEAAVKAMRNKKAKRIIVAVPVAPRDSVDHLEAIADEAIVLDNPDSFLGAVGSHYMEFEQVDDEEVRALLREVRDEVQQTASTRPSSVNYR
jgi:predicted phosphoribosyltransferase